MLKSQIIKYPGVRSSSVNLFSTRRDILLINDSVSNNSEEETYYVSHIQSVRLNSLFNQVEHNEMHIHVRACLTT